MTTRTERERQLVERAATAYLEQGFEVTHEPSSAELPPGLASHRFDLVARRGDEIVVVEVRYAGEIVHRPTERLDRLARDVAAIDGARLDVLWIPPPGPSLAEKSELRSRAESAVVVSERAPGAAIVLAWGCLEGAMRWISGAEGRRERTALDLAASLYSEGVLTKDQWTTVDDSWRQRNAAAHGFKMAGEESVSDLVMRLADIAVELLDDDYEASQSLVTWFFERYEDPILNAPFESREGGYLIEDRSIEPSEVLEREFPEVSDRVRDKAVVIISRYGDLWIPSTDAEP